MGLPIAVQQSSDLECSIFFLHIPGGKKMLALKMQTADTSAGGDKVAEKAAHSKMKPPKLTFLNKVGAPHHLIETICHSSLPFLTEKFGKLRDFKHQHV